MAETESPGTIARTVMRGADRATLATSLESADGVWPYGSLVMAALDSDASPLVLISELAEHTKNLRRNSRASLLFDATAGLDNPLTGARVTIVGEMAPIGDERQRGRYVAHHPSAAGYRDFHDFHLWRLTPLRAHLVAGFGRIHWIDAAALMSPQGAATALAEAEPGILAHMNGDHRATIDLYAAKLLGLSGEGWRMVAVDPDGADLRRDHATARLPFTTPVADADGVRRAFIELAQAARAR